MQKHIVELYDHVYTNTSPSAQKQSEWQNIVDRVQKQLYLRVVSCCQIASKLNSHYKLGLHFIHCSADCVIQSDAVNKVVIYSLLTQTQTLTLMKKNC